MKNKMKHCKTCGNSLDKRAKICPQCGKDQRNFFQKHKIITGLLIIIIIGALGSSANTTSNISDKTSSVVSKETSNDSDNPSKAEENSFKLEAGSYKVGTDLEEGLYMAVSKNGFSYLEVSSDSTGELSSIITNDNFALNRYIYLAEGQYLKLKGAVLVKYEESSLDMSNSENFKNGMYKVGHDIEPGEYKVKSTGNMGYLEVSSNANGTLQSIVSNDNFEGEKYITVQQGQYLKLSNAELLLNK